MGGDTYSTPSPHEHNPDVWYDADDSIPYVMTYRAKRCRTLDRADLARWMKAPVVR